MISTLLRGGLGNQMFIYAAARAMAWRNNVELVLDRHSGFANDIQYGREFALKDFKISPFCESKIRTFSYKYSKKIYGLSRRIGRNILLPTQRIIQQDENDSSTFMPMVIDKEITEAYLAGYWQNEKYFNDYENKIRDEFTFTRDFSDDVISERKSIEECDGTPIGLGIRLYQECKDGEMHVIGKEYYERAMDYILSIYPDAVFFVFTQVQEWARENLDKNKYRLIFIKDKPGNDSAVDDMMLYSSCKHHIISNSSYYWWGAWLAKPTVNHIVVCPVMWRSYACYNWKCI